MRRGILWGGGNRRATSLPFAHEGTRSAPREGPEPPADRPRRSDRRGDPRGRRSWAANTRLGRSVVPASELTAARWLLPSGTRIARSGPAKDEPVGRVCPCPARRVWWPVRHERQWDYPVAVCAPL